MINKQLFIEILTQIQKDEKNVAELTSVFRKMNNDFISGSAFINPELTDLILRLLDAQFGEDCDWVRYWVYELDCGNNAKSMHVEDPDGNMIILETIDQLWDWCNELVDN